MSKLINKRINHRIGTKNLRKNSGSGLIDLGFAAIMMIAMAVFALDITMAILAYGVNDRACRDAARAAAQGSNLAEAQRLAQSALISHQTNASALTSPTIESLSYTDFAGQPPSGVSPIVRVVTRSQVRVPAPIAIFGSAVMPDSFTVRKAYVFPIVKLTVNI